MENKEIQVEKIIVKGKYPIIDVPADGNPDWYEGSFCLLFVYSRDKGNFIIRGFRREAEKYLKENYTHYFYYLSMWNNSESRGHWIFWKDSVSIYRPSKIRKDWKFKIVKHSLGNGYMSMLSKERYSKEMNLKRMPKRWIPEFNEF